MAPFGLIPARPYSMRPVLAPGTHTSNIHMIWNLPRKEIVKIDNLDIEEQLPKRPMMDRRKSLEETMASGLGITQTGQDSESNLACKVRQLRKVVEKCAAQAMGSDLLVICLTFQRASNCLPECLSWEGCDQTVLSVSIVKEDLSCMVFIFRNHPLLNSDLNSTKLMGNWRVTTKISLWVCKYFSD